MANNVTNDQLSSKHLQEPRTMDRLTAEGLEAKLQHSYEQSLAGEGRPFNEVFDALEKGLS